MAVYQYQDNFTEITGPLSEPEYRISANIIIEKRKIVNLEKI